MSNFVLSDASLAGPYIRQDIFFFYNHENGSCGFILFVSYAISINLSKYLDLGIGPLSLSIFDNIFFGKETPEIIYSFFFDIISSFYKKSTI